MSLMLCALDASGSSAFLFTQWPQPRGIATRRDERHPPQGCQPKNWRATIPKTGRPTQELAGINPRNGRDTAQTERILMRLDDTSPLDSRLRHSGKVSARHPCVEPVLSFSLCQCCTHDSSFLLSPYFAHGSGAPGYSMLIHCSTLCRLKSYLRDWSISRIKPCKQDNDKVQRNRRWQRPNNVSSSYSQEAVHQPRQLESSTRVLWASRRRSRVSHRNEKKNLAIHVQGVCVCDAFKNERRVRVSDTDRLGSCDQQ